MKRYDHVCCLCSKRHRNGAKGFDKTRERCAKNCTRKPITSRPHGWVGKGACSLCGAITPRGQRRCKNRDTCTVRALGSMRAIRHDDAWTRTEYDIAMGTYEYPSWARARQEEAMAA